MTARPARSPIHAPALLLALLTTLLAPVTGARASGQRIMCQGRVLSQAGQGMADWPVILIGTSRYLEIGKHTSGGEVATLARTSTDENGYYSIDIPRERRYHYYFLRFADSSKLDPVKYSIPDDVEISAEARRGRLAQVDLTVRLHPDWPEVERRIAEAGGVDTPKGKILRKLGLPEKSVMDRSSGEEEWWYFTKGVLYTFRGSEPTGTRNFEPVSPPPGGAGSTGEGR